MMCQRFSPQPRQTTAPYPLPRLLSQRICLPAAFYMIAFEDAEGDALVGDQHYKLRVPKEIPAELFWSVTLGEADASGR